MQFELRQKPKCLGGSLRNFGVRPPAQRWSQAIKLLYICQNNSFEGLKCIRNKNLQFSTNRIKKEEFKKNLKSNAHQPIKRNTIFQLFASQ